MWVFTGSCHTGNVTVGISLHVTVLGLCSQFWFSNSGINGPVKYNTEHVCKLFLATVILPSVKTVAIPTPSRSVWEGLCAHLEVIPLLNGCQLEAWKMEWPCCFNLHFPNYQWRRLFLNVQTTFHLLSCISLPYAAKKLANITSIIPDLEEEKPRHRAIKWHSDIS